MSNFVVRQAQLSDYTAAGRLVSLVQFPEDRRKQAMDYWLKRLPHEPGFSYAAHRVGVLDGSVVSYLGVKPYTLRYGRVNLRVAGVADVSTHPDYRRRGYAAAVLRDALAYMAEMGVHLALLNSDLPQYYDRFGFSPVWPFYYFEVSAGEAAALEPPLILREARAGDVPQMARLYRRHWEGRVAFARSRDLWMWRVLQADWGYIRVVEDPRGQVAGYIAGDNPAGEVTEALADTLKAAVTILAEVGRLAQAAGQDTLRWLMPPDDALVSFARAVLPVTVSATYLPSGGWMARLIDTRGLVEAILPEITAQARLSDPRFDADALHFDFQPDRVKIGLRGQPSADCLLDQHDFIQIVFGSLRPAALALRGHLHPDAVLLLEALFPPRMAALACWDWF